MSSKVKAYEIVSAIKEEIITGKLQPKERLKEEDIANRFNVSRTPVREALNILVNIGLAQEIPYKGAQVAMFDKHKIVELYQVRKVLEGLATELATPEITKEGKMQLDEMLVYMDTAISELNFEAYGKLQDEFHELIYSFCPNSYLRDLTKELLLKTVTFRRASSSTIKTSKSSNESHKKIVEAIHDNNPKLARRLTEDHVEIILKSLSVED
ncbi:MAG: GntR family transcriptional regulator [Eubacteriales bacterium]|nr:GntR family transcriptional regulator [Clostridiales bacterium]MDY5835646.1 GntR family transcriptional regulator [Eubacteriales bacterium]